MWTPPRLAAQDNVEDVLIAWDQEIRKSNKCKNSYTLLDIVTR